MEGGFVGLLVLLNHETKGITKSIPCNERSSRPAAEKLGKGGGGNGGGHMAGGGVGEGRRRGAVREGSDAVFDVADVELLIDEVRHGAARRRQRSGMRQGWGGGGGHLHRGGAGGGRLGRAGSSM